MLRQTIRRPIRISTPHRDRRRPFAVEAGESRGAGGSGAGRAAPGYRLRRGNERRRADGACRSAPCERGAGATLYGFRHELVLKDLEARRLTGDGDARLIAQTAAALAALQSRRGRPLIGISRR